MERRYQKRAAFILGIILALSMVVSLILPLLANTFGFQTIHGGEEVAERPTPLPPPTVPAPITDLASIHFDETYLHPSGIFTVSVPDGWTPNPASLNPISPVGRPDEVLVTMSNPDQLSVVEVRIIDPGIEIDEIGDLDEIFTSSWLASSWREYLSWKESTRRIENNRLLIDFELGRSRQNYIARQEAWYDGEWVYVTRVVTPSNAAEQLLYVLENVTGSIKNTPQYVGAPLDWNSYFDAKNRHIIRFPQTWEVTDSETGVLTSVSDGNGILRIETDTTTVQDAATAGNWVASWRSGVEVLSVEPVERDGAEGFSVAYARTTPDGDIQSGLAILLNDSDEQLHIANLRFDSLETVDLNDPETAQTYSEYVSILDSFYLAPELEVATAQ